MNEHSEDNEGNICKEAHEENVNTEACNTDGKTGGESEHNKNKISSQAVPQKAKRTSKRRPTHNRSIIQSAIARKEKSFENYVEPRSRTKRQVKNKEIPVDKREESVNSQNSYLRKSVQSLHKPQNDTKKLKRRESDTEKSDLEAESLVNRSQDTELNLRRSQRTLSSDNKGGTSLMDSTSEDSLLKTQLSSRLCKCTENKGLLMDTDSESQFCTAVDSISDKLIGCSRLVDVRTVPMHRPSTRIPFGVFCDAHIQRLIKHNCCPTCGVFCTQGQFVECPGKHQFHKDCRLSVGDLTCCPHCGDFTDSTDIMISMYSSKKPIFLPVQRSHHTSAKMSFETNKEVLDNSSVEQVRDAPAIISEEQLQMLRNQATPSVNNYIEYDLVQSILNENLEKVAAILGSGNINLNTRLEEYNNGTFLHLAILKGNIQIVFLLVSALIDLELLDKEQNSPLMLAVSEQKNDIVAYLLKGGADITLKGTDGMTALHIAAKCGNLEACRIILSFGFGTPNFVNSQDDGGWTPLVWACEHGYVDVAKFLVFKGGDVNIRDVEHNVALHWAAFSGSSQIVELLLNWKCDVNVVNVHGDTPLHIGAREDRYNCVIILLGRNANVSLINRNNETPLDCAPKDGNCFNLLALNVQLCSAMSMYTARRKSILNNDISKGRELNPIQCYNSIDSEGEPKNYTYIKKNCITSDDIQINWKVSTIQSCICNDRCMSSECACGRLSLRCWYDEEGRLLSEFNFCDPPLIFECNEMCSCNSILCQNRLVQKPLIHRFQLFKTDSKGWGIRTLNFIARGNYVCEYVGEILTDREADQREDDSYLFDLDNREIDSFCIDAKYYGNFARFINHSCDPNLHPVKVFVDHHDLRFPRIALFAKRDIRSDEELSFDYGDKFWLVKYKSFTCDCRANICKYSEETIKSTLEKYQMII